MSDKSKMNILLVDDRQENLVALEAVLQGLGQNIVMATSGQEALKHILADDFAVVLLDVQMPGMSGFETASLIRAREKSQHTPIVFLTANNKSDMHVSRGYSVGAVDYVFKPFEPEILRAKVGAFVELSQKTKELQEEVARRKQAEEEVLELNRELEHRVAERTAALKAANEGLKVEIAERKRAEEVLALNKVHIEGLNDQLRRAMTETHHRVKNNLQLIAAMLDIHLLEGNATISAHEIKRLGSYVRTLAAVHDILTQQAKEDGVAHSVSAKQVLEKLLPMLQETSSGRVLDIVIEDARLTARQGTSLAIITNELVSNALKHGKGSVAVALKVQDNTATLTVSDDGPGFPENFQSAQAASTRLEIIEHLSKWDMGGKVTYANRPTGGAVVTVDIPIYASDSMDTFDLPKDK